MKSLVTQSTDLTKTEEFEPTPAMRVWLDFDIQLMTDNITEIEKASKITAQSWYNWIKNPAFVEWYNAEFNRRLRVHGPTLDKIGLKNAKKDFKYWEGMQKRVGNLKDEGESKSPIQINTQVNVDKYVEE